MTHIITMYGHGCFGWSRWTYFGGYCACEWCKTYLHDLSQRGNLAATWIWCACCCQARMLEHPPFSLLIFPAINLHLVHCIFELAVASHVWLPWGYLGGPAAAFQKALPNTATRTTTSAVKTTWSVSRSNQWGHCWKALNPCPERGSWTCWVTQSKWPNWKPRGNASIVFFTFWTIIFYNDKPSYWMWRKYSTHQTRSKLYPPKKKKQIPARLLWTWGPRQETQRSPNTQGLLWGSTCLENPCEKRKQKPAI